MNAPGPARHAALAAHYAFDYAGEALLAAGLGQDEKARYWHVKACVEAMNAFPEGSEQAVWLNGLLDYVGLAAAFAGLEATP